MRKDQLTGVGVIAGVEQGKCMCRSQGSLKTVSFSMFSNDLEGEVNLILIRLTNVVNKSN